VGLILSTLTLFIAIGKFGLQHSIVRFYTDIKKDNPTYSQQCFYSTSLFLGLFLAIVTSSFCIFAGYIIAPHFIDYLDIGKYFLIGGGYVFLRMLGSNISNVLTAQLESRLVMHSTVIRRSAYLLILIFFVLTGIVNVFFVLLAFAAAELICFSYLLFHYLPGKRHAIAGFNNRLAKELLRYGLSLMVLETMGLMMRTSDRYIIQSLLGENSLGQYAASYNLVGYLEVVILASLISTIKPIYLHIWESKGRIETCRFLSTSLSTYLMLGIPFVAVFSLCAAPLLKLLASENYAPGTVIIPWVTSAMLVEGAILFVAAGIHITKTTSRLIVWAVVAVLLNVILNFTFIPLFGIEAASAVTFFTYCTYCLGLAFSSFKVLSFKIPLRNPIIMVLASLLVWWLLNQMQINSRMLEICVKGLLALIALGTVVVSIDANIRMNIVTRITTKAS